jgi:hypothetical protein
MQAVGGALQNRKQLHSVFFLAKPQAARARFFNKSEI